MIDWLVDLSRLKTMAYPHKVRYVRTAYARPVTKILLHLASGVAGISCQEGDETKRK